MKQHSVTLFQPNGEEINYDPVTDVLWANDGSAPWIEFTWKDLRIETMLPFILATKEVQP